MPYSARENVQNVGGASDDGVESTGREVMVSIMLLGF